MVGLEKSTDIWKRLYTSYISRTRAIIKKLKLLLKTPKNDKFVSTYLLDIKKTVDNLAAVGVDISIEEHIEAILDGLSDEYDGFITSILLCTDPYSVDDLEALLLAQEERFEKHKTQSSLLQANTISGNVTVTNPTNSRSRFNPNSSRVVVCLQETLVLPAPIALPILVFPTTMLQISICLGTLLNIRPRFMAKLVIQLFIVGTGMISLNKISSLLTCLNFLLTQMNNSPFLEYPSLIHYTFFNENFNKVFFVYFGHDLACKISSEVYYVV